MATCEHGYTLGWDAECCEGELPSEPVAGLAAGQEEIRWTKIGS
jgi:hypothetical protein